MANSSRPEYDSKRGVFPASLVDWPNLSAEGSEREATALRRNSDFITLIARIVKPGDRHFSLAELRDLAQCRRKASEDWELPEHLAACPLCLELCQALLDESTPLSDPARARYQQLWPRLMLAHEQFRPTRSWRYPLLAMAASLMIAAIGSYLLMSGLGRISGTVLEGSGSLLDRGGSIFSSGATVPMRQEIVTETGMRLALADGSRITVAPQSRFHLAVSRIGRVTLDLDSGEINLVVSKQTLGRTLVVRTALGEISVVGTQFRVKTIANDALVYQQTAGQGTIRSYRENVQSVVVSVTEGAVKVRNARNEVQVNAGHSAILRGDQPLITVYQTLDEPKP